MSDAGSNPDAPKNPRALILLGLAVALLIVGGVALLGRDGGENGDASGDGGPLVGGGGDGGNHAADTKVTTLGTVEVTAELQPIRYWKEGETNFPPNDLYDYAYVMEYEVLEIHRGEVQGDTIYVAHFNPRLPRSDVESDTSGPVGGKLMSFRAGDIHRMALDAPVDDYLMDGLLNKYLDETRDKTIYWALWTNPVNR